MPNFETYPPVYLALAETETGDLVAAVSGKAIVVLNYTLVASAGTVVNFENGTTDITGTMTLIAGTPISACDNEFGLFQTTAGTKLAYTQTGAATVAGHLTYVLV